jgi:hypothetical protein
MKKRFLTVSFLVAAIFCTKQVCAQTAEELPKIKTYRVGIFAPLFLDSVFSTAGNFRYKEGMPKFIMPAVDFVHGAQIALDSLSLQNENVEAFFYDTKSYTEPLGSLIKNKKIDSLDLMIGAVKDMEYKQLADFAHTKNIPFISATYPNDGGVTNNPFVLLVTPTLRAHCEAIFTYTLQSHGTDKIILCRKKGVQEDKIATYLKAINEQEGKPLLNIQTLYFDSSITASQLQQKLDSNRNAILIGGSLDENFATDLANACFQLHDKYPMVLIGMPNWDNFKPLFRKRDYEDFPIYFTSPYYNTKADAYSKILIGSYAKKLKSKPTDMAFKGFECTYLFTKLLTKYPNDFMSHINEKSYKLFSDYNFRPVMLKKTNNAPDYFENKHLYFIRILNGSMSKAW